MSTAKVGRPKRTSSPERKWIANATENKGSLHRKLHVPADEPRQARLAITLSKLQNGKTAKRA